jgi:hypothetical protein
MPKLSAAPMMRVAVFATALVLLVAAKTKRIPSRSVKLLGRTGIGRIWAGRADAESSRVVTSPVHAGVWESAKAIEAEFVALVLAAAAPRWAARP